MTLLRFFRVAFVGLGFLGLIGCAPKDEIAVYEADSEPPSNVIRTPITLFAVIVPQSDRVNWVFKVSGPSAVIASERNSLIEFLQTVNFPKVDLKNPPKDEDLPIDWRLPALWKESEPKDEFRYKTIDIPTSTVTLDLSVSVLDKRGGRLLPNVNRWRGQIHRNPISEKELPLVTKKFPMAGVEATLVEMKGFKLSLPEEPEPFQYDLPPGWRKSQKAMFSLLSLQVEEEMKRATVSVTSAQGSLEDNLNRWRKQVQLPELKKAELLKDAKTLKIAGQDAVYVDYAQPPAEKLDKAPSRILGAIVQFPDAQLFVKMTGPADLLEKHKPNFERFATSLVPALKNE